MASVVKNQSKMVISFHLSKQYYSGILFMKYFLSINQNFYLSKQYYSGFYS